MTQPPQDPRQHPLQDDEVELARVLRALPGGEPSAKVDAAILAAATDAVAPEQRRRGPRRLPAWAIGTAAAAVLAIAVGTQLRPPLEPALEVQEATRPQTQAPAETESDSTLVELPAPPLLLPAPPAEVPPSPRPAEPLPIRQDSAPAASAEKPALRDAPAPPPPPAPPAPMAESAPEREADAGLLDSIEVTGSRIKRAEIEERTQVHRSVSEQRTQQRREQAKARQAAQPAPPIVNGQMPPPPDDPTREAPQAFADAASKAVLPPVADDASLPAAAWLERIRDRVRQGDRAGAMASLARFRRDHPDHPLPDDLVQLRP